MACASKALNRHLVAKRRVRLVFDQVRSDRHGRLLAYVYLENGEMVNAVMVRKGLAHVMAQRPNLRHFSLLLENQRKAMKEKIGTCKQLHLSLKNRLFDHRLVIGAHDIPSRENPQQLLRIIRGDNGKNGKIL